MTIKPNCIHRHSVGWFCKEAEDHPIHNATGIGFSHPYAAPPKPKRRIGFMFSPSSDAVIWFKHLGGEIWEGLYPRFNSPMIVRMPGTTPGRILRRPE